MRGLLLAIAAVLAMGGTAGAQTVGVTSAVNPAATGMPPTQKPRTMVIGDNVFHDEKISTDAKGLVQILLADGSSFTVGPGSTMTIDSFVYDPNAGTAQVVATLGKGAFRFIGGKASKQPDGVTLNTPVGTVGIRGGISNLDFSGATAFHIDLVYGQGVTLKDGTQVVGDICHSGYSIVIDPNGKVSTVKTPPEWTQVFQKLMAGNGGTGGGSVKSTEVASTLKDTNKNGDQPGSPPSGGIPGTGDVKPGTTTDDLDPGLDTTWAQISNSDLAGVYALYSGNYGATVTHWDGEESTSEDITGAFDLRYDFHGTGGTMTFYWPDQYESYDPLLEVGVKPDGSSGAATFSASDYFDGTLSGQFLNTPAGIGRGLTGSFNTEINNGLGTIDGTFGGTYQGPADTE